MGYVTRYVQGTDKLRRNGFEVHGMNGTNSSIIHCDNVKSLSEWVKLISGNIANLAEVQVNDLPYLSNDRRIIILLPLNRHLDNSKSVQHDSARVTRRKKKRNTIEKY